MKIIDRVNLSPANVPASIAQIDKWINTLADEINHSTDHSEDIDSIYEMLKFLEAKVDSIRSGRNASADPSQISKKTLRSAEVTLATKTWTNVHTVTPDSITLEPGIYLIQQNASIKGSSDGYIMFRPYDLRTGAEITGRRNAAPVIASTYSGCNNTWILNVEASATYQITFQAYGSGTHVVGTCEQTIVKL